MTEISALGTQACSCDEAPVVLENIANTKYTELHLLFVNSLYIDRPNEQLCWSSISMQADVWFSTMIYEKYVLCIL